MSAHLGDAGMDRPPSQDKLDRLSRLFEKGPTREPGLEPEGPVQRLGKFAILGEAGRGGTAVVYHAFEPVLKRDVALKVPLPRFRGTSRFLDEFRTAARFHHPNVVAIYEVGTADGIPYCAMEWMESGAAGAGPLAPRRTAMIVLQVARALEAAHRQGIVHADVKPANILLSGGVAKLSDFGIARSLLQAGEQPAFSGTPAFMAPEQAMGLPSEIDHRTDIFNLGATMFSLLTGRIPFADLAAARRGLIELPPGIPYEKILRKALSPDRAARYQAMGDFRRDLERALRARRPLLAYALVAIALIAAVLFVAWPRSTPQTVPPPDRREELRTLLERRHAFPADLERRRKDLAAAERLVQLLLKENPREEQLRRQHARILLAQDRPKEAAKTFTDLNALIRWTLRSMPPGGDRIAAFTKTAVETGLAKFVEGRHPELVPLVKGDPAAIRSLEPLREQSPEFAFLLGFARDGFYVAGGGSGDPVLDYMLALQKDPWWSEAHFYAGNVEIYNGHYDRTVLHADNALLLRPGWTEALFLRGAAHLCAGRAGPAYDDLREVVSRDPARADAVHDLALAELALGRTSEALVRIERLGSKEVPFLYLEARIHAERGDLVRAMDRLALAVEIATSQEEIQARSGPCPAEVVAAERLYRGFALHDGRIEEEPAFARLLAHPDYRRRVGRLLHADGFQDCRIRTEHYEFAYAGVSAALAQEFATMLEQLHQTLADFFDAWPQEDRLVVRLYATQDAFRAGLERDGLPAEESDGCFSSDTKIAYAWLHANDPYATRHALLREAANQFHSLVRPPQATWYTYGLAAHFAHHAWDGHKLTVGVLSNDLAKRAQENLEKVGWDVQGILLGRIPAGVPESWLLVRFLMSEDEEALRSFGVGGSAPEVDGEEFKAWVEANIPKSP